MIKYITNNLYRYKSEYLIISYMKSGRTWLRVLLAKTFMRNFNNNNFYLNIEKYSIENKSIPFIFFSHEMSDINTIWYKISYFFSKLFYKNKKILFLIRDPRDIVVSLYYHKVNRDKTYSGTISDFIRHKDFGIISIINFINNSYKLKNICKDYIFVTYEDMKCNINKELLKINIFFKFDKITKTDITNIIKYGDFKHMQTLEKKNKFIGGYLNNRDSKNPSSLKCRKGIIGDYKNVLSINDLNYVNQQMNKLKVIKDEI